MKQYTIYLTQKGLTLIELLAVIVILAIIAAIAIPSIQSVIQNQRDKALMSEIVNMVSTAKIAHMDNECENLICTYDSSSNSISFKSSKFTECMIDFTLGTSSDKIVIKNLNIDSSIFKGRNAGDYEDLINQTGGFSEQQLLDALAK